MKKMRLRLLSLFLLVACSPAALGEFISVNLTTDKSSYQVGETINWSARFDIGGSTSSNFGIATISMSLRDSLGDILAPGIVNNTFPGFAGYLRSGGTWDPGSLQLLEIGAALSQQNFSVVGANGSTLSSIPLATGSYIAVSSGAHTLIGSPGTTNNFFNTADALNSNTLPSYSSVSFNNATFNVTAVPEPGSVMLIGLLAGAVCVRRIRRISRSAGTH